MRTVYCSPKHACRLTVMQCKTCGSPRESWPENRRTAPETTFCSKRCGATLAQRQWRAKQEAK